MYYRLTLPLLGAAIGLMTLLGMLAGAATTQAAPVATITVNTTVDDFGLDSNCSLREAIQAANNNTAFGGCTAGTGADIIVVPAGIYTLTLDGVGEDENATGDLDTTDGLGLTINGALSTTTIIYGDGLDRVLHAVSGPITVTNLTVRNGNTTSNGGGALFATTAVVSNTIFRANTGDSGGGAYFGATAWVSNTTFISNTGGNNGGGVYFFTTASVARSAFVSNTTVWFGGGLHSDVGVQVTGTLFMSNVAQSGGGVFLLGSGYLTNTTFMYNTGANGGGLATFVTNGIRQVTNGLFVGNRATNAGAAIYVDNATPMRIMHTTITSPTLVAGAAIYANAGTVYVTNTIVTSHSTGLQGGNVSAWNTLFYGNSNNTVGGAISNNPVPGNPAFVNPAARNYHLAPASAAINAGLTPNPNVSFDVDGDARPQSTGYDIGYDETPYAFYTLTVAILGAGNGTVNPNLGVHTYPYGTVVTLTATPDANSTFTGWMGDCGTLGSCVVTLTANRTVTATFRPNGIFLPMTVRLVSGWGGP